MYEHRYKHGKILEPISPEQFEKALAHPYNEQLIYKAFIVLLYYTGVRVSELLRAVKEDFRASHSTLYWDVGRRLKHGRHTKPLPLALEQPHMNLVLEHLAAVKAGARVFDFHRVTAWRHVSKSGMGYNHLARLSAMTFFLKEGYSIAHIVNWFGVSVQTVNDYIGELDLAEMGKVVRT